MTVYVVQEVPKFNITVAQKYGNLEIILPPGNMSFSTEATLKKAADKLSSFTKDDYLLMIGDPIAMAICFTVALSKADGNLNVLKWDRQTNSYNVVNININKVLGERYD